MPETTYRGRRAAQIENDRLRLTVLQEGGHIAEILDKSTGVNPLCKTAPISRDSAIFARSYQSPHAISQL